MKWVLAFALALLAVPGTIPPHPHALRFPSGTVHLPVAEGRRFQIAGGPTVYLAEDHTLPLVEITVALPIGSFLDPPDKAGLSYLTGAQLRRAGTARLSADEFDERSDDLGAQIDSVAGATRSGASLSVPSWAMDEGLDLFFHMLSEPAFQADRIDATRTNLLEQMSRRNQDPLEILQREWDWLMYGERHFSARPITPASLAAIDRQDLVDFHRRFWRPAVMILAISGDFDPREMLSRLEESFSDWPAADAGPETTAWPPPAPQSVALPGLYHYEADFPQAKVLLGHRLSTFLDWEDPDRFALAVMAEILGGSGAISRIAGRLRTAEGLVYRATVDLDSGELWPGSLRIFFETQNASVARAVELALAEIDRGRASPVHPRELEVAKQTILARLRLDFDTAEEIAGYFAQDELLGRPHGYWQGYLEGIGGVPVSAVTETARVFIQPDELVVLVVGRWSEISADATAGQSTLEQICGHQVTHLPARDPSTLLPIGSAESTP